MNTCDWCDNAARVKTQDGMACKRHVRDLEQMAKFRLWQSGNAFAGEAAEGLIARGGSENEGESQ